MRFIAASAAAAELADRKTSPHPVFTLRLQSVISGFGNPVTITLPWSQSDILTKTGRVSLAPMTMNQDRCALVTGASSGSGEAIARRLASDGLRVFGASRKGIDSGVGVESLVPASVSRL